MVVESAGSNQIQVWNERDTVDSVVMSLPRFKSNDIILIIQNFLKRSTHTSDESSRGIILLWSRVCSPSLTLRGLILSRTSVSLEIDSGFMVILILSEFSEQACQVPLLKVSSFISSVENHRLGVEVHTSDRELYGLSANNIVILIFDLLFFIEEKLSCEELIFEWTWNDSVEIQITIHVSRDERVVTLEEFADLDLWESCVAIWTQSSFLLLILMVVNGHITIV